MRHAIRALLRDRSYATIALLTVAFGVAINTIMFSIVDGVLLRPLEWREGGQLAVVHEIVPELSRNYPLLPVNHRHFFEWRDRSKSFAELAILGVASAPLTHAGQPEEVGAATTSWNFLSMLGAPLQRGRNFREEEDQPGHAEVAILSDALWNRKFHRDPGVLGRSIVLGGRPGTIIGILSPSFHFPRLEGRFTPLPPKVDIFTLARFDRNQGDWFGEFNFTVIGRLKPGVSVQRAQAEMNVLQASIANRFPDKLHLRAAVAPLDDEMVGPVRRGLLVLFGAVAAVLLIACVNLANLSLARATGRGRELAIRAALGAGRAQLLRSALTESVCIGLAGGMAGILLAALGLRVVLRYLPVDLPRVEGIGMDARVLLFGLAISFLTALLFGILPAWGAASADPQDVLRRSSHTITENRRGGFTRDLLMGFESGLSALLLIAAGLMIGSFVRLLQVDKGFEAGRLLATEINLPANGYGDDKQRELYYRRLIAKLQDIPGVTGAAVVSHLPLEGEDWIDFVEKHGEHRTMAELPPTNYRFCSPDYFRTFGIPLLAGRAFTEGDRNRNLAVVSEEVARLLWPGENPVGKSFGTGDDQQPEYEVAGVAGDVRVGMARKPVPTVYVPYWRRNRPTMVAVLRTSADPPALASMVRSTVSSIDSETVIGQVRTMQEVASGSVARQRFQMWLITGFAASALLLACIGLYGVVSWSVSRRRNEIGIRMALGARPADVHRLILGHALRPVFGGLAAGVVAALLLGRVLNSVLFGISAHDPLTIAVVTAVLSGVASLACYLPSRRAVRGHPLDAIRYE